MFISRINKLRTDRYFASNPKKSDDYSYMDISFEKMTDAYSHEIAHYIQLVKHGKSSCENDLKQINKTYE